MEGQTANETPQEQVKSEECDLVEVEKGLEDTTKIIVEDFNNGHIDATTTLTGLQLVRYTREACGRGDLQACKQLELIRNFLERVRPEQVQNS